MAKLKLPKINADGEVDLDAFKTTWDALGQKAQGEQIVDLMVASMTGFDPVFEVFEFLWDKEANTYQKSSALSGIWNTQNLHHRSFFYFPSQDIEYARKFEGFHLVIEKLIKFNNAPLIEDYQDAIRKSNTFNSIAQTFNEEAKENNCTDQVLAFVLSLFTLHRFLIEKFLWMRDSENYPLTKKVFEKVDSDYIDQYREQPGAVLYLGDFVRKKTFQDPNKTYFELLFERKEFDILEKNLRWFADHIDNKISDVVELNEDLEAFYQPFFGTQELRASYPPGLWRALFDVFSQYMTKDEKKTIQREIDMLDDDLTEITSPPRGRGRPEGSGEGEIFEKSQWQTTRIEILENLLGEGASNYPDISKALDHLANHARYHLNSHGRSSRALEGKNKSYELTLLLKDLKQIEGNDTHDKLQNAMDRIQQVFEAPSKLDENRGGFFGAYKKFSELMDKFHRPHYRITVNHQTHFSKSRTGHYLIELNDAVREARNQFTLQI